MHEAIYKYLAGKIDDLKTVQRVNVYANLTLYQQAISCTVGSPLSEQLCASSIQDLFR